MKRAVLVLAICFGLLGTFTVVKWLSMYDDSRGFNELTIFKNDLVDGVKPTIDWIFFRNADFPTGKCESRIDIPMIWIGVLLLVASGLSGFGWSRMRTAEKSA